MANAPDTRRLSHVPLRNGGDEKIGINTGQTIELQLTGGKGCIIEDLEVKNVRKTFRSAGLPDPEISTSTAWVTDAFAKSDAHRFKLTGDKPGTTWLFASDFAGNERPDCWSASDISNTTPISCWI